MNPRTVPTPFMIEYNNQRKLYPGKCECSWSSSRTELQKYNPRQTLKSGA